MNEPKPTNVPGGVNEDMNEPKPTNVPGGVNEEVVSTTSTTACLVRLITDETDETYDIEKRIMLKRQEKLIKDILMGRDTYSYDKEMLPMEDNGSLLLPNNSFLLFTSTESDNIKRWIDNEVGSSE